MNNSRDFKGIWISRDIWLSRDLSPSEKILLAEIDSLDNDEEKGCFASDEYLAEFLQVKPGTLANMLTKLKKDGYIKRVFFDGRRRGLRTRFSRHSESRVHKKMKSDFTKKLTQPSQKNEHIYRSIDKDYNKGEYNSSPAAEKNQEPAKNGKHTESNGSLMAVSLNGKDPSPPGSARPPLPEPAFKNSIEQFDQAWLDFQALHEKNSPFSLAYEFKKELRNLNVVLDIQDLLAMWKFFQDCTNKKMTNGGDWRVFLKQKDVIYQLWSRFPDRPELLWADKTKKERI